MESKLGPRFEYLPLVCWHQWHHTTHVVASVVSRTLEWGIARYQDYAAFSISLISASESERSAAFMFSSRCATEEVPGIGRITGLRCSSQAMESCATVLPWRFAISSSLPPGCASLPAATGNQGMKAILWRSQYSRTSSCWRSPTLYRFWTLTISTTLRGRGQCLLASLR